MVSLCLISSGACRPWAPFRSLPEALILQYELRSCVQFRVAHVEWLSFRLLFLV